MRNLDLTALRSFVAVADTGGVTRATNVLNLTQSAVSMQLKRLEDSLGLSLIDRSGRTVGLTAPGEQLVAYARRMLALNDEACARLTAQEYAGEIRLGVPHDIIYPRIPPVLKQFATEFPRLQVQLVSAPTLRLKQMFARGEIDVILTTENTPGEGGETLITLPLVWIGATEGTAWRQRPLPVAFCSNCVFRPGVMQALDAAQMPWRMVVDSELDNAVEAAVSADLGIHVAIQGNLPPQTEVIAHGGALPEIGKTNIVLYVQRPQAKVDAALARLLRVAHQATASLSAVVAA